MNPCDICNHKESPTACPYAGTRGAGKFVQGCDKWDASTRLIDTYVAAPYSHPDPAVRELRFRQINAYCAAQMAAGVILYSPISHCHPIALAHALPTDWAFWERFDRAMIGCCQRLTVLTLDGWRESTGVQAEIKIALEMGIPVEHVLDADKIVSGPEVAEYPDAGTLVGVQNPDGKLATGLHALAGDAWDEFMDGTRMTLEAAWGAGYRDTLYRCWPAPVAKSGGAEQAGA
jgi:hypothetical protein